MTAKQRILSKYFQPWKKKMPRGKKTFRIRTNHLSRLMNELPLAEVGGVDVTFTDALIEANKLGLRGKQITRFIPGGNPAMLTFECDVVFGDSCEKDRES